MADKKTRRSFDLKKGVAPALIAKLQDLGLIARNVQDTIAFCPPLIITSDQINEMFDIVEKGLNQLEAHVHTENLRAA